MGLLPNFTMPSPPLATGEIEMPTKPFGNPAQGIMAKRIKCNIRTNPGTRTVVSQQRWDEILRRAQSTGERQEGYTDHWQCQSVKEVRR